LFGLNELVIGRGVLLHVHDGGDGGRDRDKSMNSNLRRLLQVQKMKLFCSS